MHGVTGRHASLSEMRQDAIAVLARAGFEDPRAEADALLAAVLDISRGEVVLGATLGRPIPAEFGVSAPATPAELGMSAPPTSAERATSDASVETRLRSAILRRSRREPLQRIVGTAPFFDMDLAVGPGVFIPRPETELLVECALKLLAAKPTRLLDVGSGTGAVALGLARRCPGPGARVTAVERSPRAWPWLNRNIRTYGEGRVDARFGAFGELAVGNFRGLGLAAGERFDAIVSNPPYIPARLVPNEPEVRLYDPPLALYGGEDGLSVIRELATLGRRLVLPGSPLVLEHDASHAAGVRATLEDAGWRDVETRPDLAGRDRITWGTAP